MPEAVATIPMAVLSDPTLSAEAVLVYVALTGRTDRHGKYRGSLAMLAEESRCSLWRMHVALTELHDADLISDTDGYIAVID